MYGESRVEFILSEADKERIETTLITLRDIIDVFVKYGSCVDTEINTIKEAEKVIAGIAKGKLF